MQSTPFIVPWVISITLTAAMSVYALRRRKNLAALPFASMCFFATWWSVFYIVGLVSLDLSFKILTTKLMYIGVVGVPLSWTAFALAFSGRGDWINRRSISLVLIIPIITLILILTNEFHYLFWSETTLRTDGMSGLVVLWSPQGWWFWVHAVYLYAILLFGTVFLLRQLWEAQNVYRWQILVNIIAILMPWIANVLVVFSLIRTLLDITSLTFSLSILVLGWGYFRYGFLDLVPVAQRAVFASIPDIILVLDPGLRVAELNPAASRTFGLDGKPVVGQPFKLIFGEWLPFDDASLRMNGYHQELFITVNSGLGKWFDVFASTLFDNPDHVAGHLITLRDITSFKENEAALAIARDDAVRADNFKTQLLANVSHELRTPLGVISGYTDLLMRTAYGALTKKQAVVLGRVKESTLYLEELVSELIDQSLLDSGKMQLIVAAFEPRLVFEQVFNQLSVLAESKKLGFIGEISGDIPRTILGDGLRLKQILVNLLGNAIKFTEKGSVQAKIYLASEDSWAMQVKDSGPGIPPGAEEIIFEPFRQLDPSARALRKGYGLGLSISRQFVELMGGNMKLESAPGKGSTFTVILPLVTDFDQPE